MQPAAQFDPLIRERFAKFAVMSDTTWMGPR
jgi:hypothetical protein